LKDNPPILIECKNILPYFGYHTISTSFRLKIEGEKWDGGTYYHKHSSPGGRRWSGLKPMAQQVINPKRVIVITVTAFLLEQDENRLRRKFEIVELGHGYLPTVKEEPTFKDPQPECMENTRRRLRTLLTILIEKHE
jgi:hypothetical protein